MKLSININKRTFDGVIPTNQHIENIDVMVQIVWSCLSIVNYSEEKKGREKERQEYDTSDHHGNYKIIMG